MSDSTVERHGLRDAARRGAAKVSLRRRHPKGSQQQQVVERTAHDAVVDCALYVDGRRQKGRLPYEGALEAAEQSGGFVWIGLHEPTDEQVQGVATEFGLHPLAVEDAVNAHQRPKLERYGDHIFLVLKTARYVEHEQFTWQSEVVETGEIMLFVGRNFIVSVRHGDACSLAPVRDELEHNEKLAKHGPAGVLYKIADHVVDDYLDVAAEVEDDIDEVEQQVFAPSRGDDTQRVYQLKRELIEFKRAVVPLGRPMELLLTSDKLSGIHDYLRDVDDHLRRVTEQVEGYDELLNAMLDVNLTRISVQQNDDMRKITAYAALITVPTLIAGIYGMNFDHMPELHWKLGYPMAIGIMVVICSLMWRAFKRSGWL